MADHAITFQQMHVCLIRADEIADSVDSGSDPIDRLSELCSRYDAELDFDMLGLAEALATVLCRNRAANT